MKIVDYIAQDKPNASLNFAKEVESFILIIPDNPYKYRKSHYFDDRNIRDMIYKGYTIIFRIKPIKNVIEILRIFNKNKPN